MSLSSFPTFSNPFKKPDQTNPPPSFRRREKTSPITPEPMSTHERAPPGPSWDRPRQPFTATTSSTTSLLYKLVDAMPFPRLSFRRRQPSKKEERREPPSVDIRMSQTRSFGTLPRRFSLTSRGPRRTYTSPHPPTASSPTTQQRSSSSGTQTLDANTPTVSISIATSELRGVIDTGGRKSTATGASSAVRIFHKKRVRVEASIDSARDFVFYAPEGDPNHRRAIPTQFIKISPSPRDDSIVRRTDDFEISFVGMSIAPEDTTFGDQNELLLYSLKTDPASMYENNDHPVDEVEQIQQEGYGDPHNQYVDFDTMFSPTNGFALAPDDVPFIHYDAVFDGHDVSVARDSFIPVPASKALYLQYHAANAKKVKHGLTSVPVRFMVLEIDKISDAQSRAIGNFGIANASTSTVSQSISTSVPYIQPMSMAVNAASGVGKNGLKKYNKPDHVMSKDLAFFLAEPEEEHGDESSGSSVRNGRVESYGNFLRVCLSFLFLHFYSSLFVLFLCFLPGCPSNKAESKDCAINPKYAPE